MGGWVNFTPIIRFIAQLLRSRQARFQLKLELQVGPECGNMTTSVPPRLNIHIETDTRLMIHTDTYTDTDTAQTSIAMVSV